MEKGGKIDREEGEFQPKKQGNLMKKEKKIRMNEIKGEKYEKNGEKLK